MSFKLVAHPTFSADVLLTVPAQAERSQIVMDFRAMLPEKFKSWYLQTFSKPVTRRERLVSAWQSIINRLLRRQPLSMRDVVLELVQDWHGVVGEDDSPLEFSRERLLQLLDTYPLAALEIMEAYVTGYQEGRRKN